MDEIETINIELEHSVAKLLSENERLHKEIEHLKKIYKHQFHSIKKTRALSKEHCDFLVAQLNSKSMENTDLKGQIQEKVFVTTTLQSELRRLKGKHVLDNATTITNATTIAPGIKPQRETTYQATLDALKLSPCYLAFLITAEVPKVYMHQFWKTIKKIKDTDAYRFKLDKQKFRIDTKVFCVILQICPRLPNQDFVEPPFKEEMVPFIKELRCISRKSTGLDRLKPSRAQILWGMFYHKNVDYKLTTVLEEEPAKKPKQAKKPEPAKQAETEKKTALAKKSSTMQTAGVIIRDTPSVSVSKKKAQAKVDRGKGMDLLSDVALLEAAQLKKALKKSKQDTHMLYTSGSDDGVGSQPKVPDELKEKKTGTNEGTGIIPKVPNVPKDQSENENESWGDSGDDDDSNDDDSDDGGNNVKSNDDHEQADDERTESNDEEEEKQDDEYIHTPEHYVPTDLTVAKPADKEKDDEEMIVAGHVNVNQEGTGNQVKDDAQATQKNEGPIPSSFILSDYAAKYLIFDNIPSVDTEVVSMLDINVQHEVLRTLPFLTISVFVIPEHTVVNLPEIVTTAITDLEKDIKELKTVDHSSILLLTIKFEVPKAVKEYLGTSMDDALHKVLQKHSADITKEHSVPAEIVERLRQQYVLEKRTEDIRKIKMGHARQQQVPKETITSSDTTALIEFDQKTTLFETMTKSKSFNKIPKQRALYHALMESILEDEDAIDEGVVDKLKKRKQDDADKNEGPSAGSNRGLKRRKTSKDTEPSNKAKLTETSKGFYKGTKSIDVRPPQTWISKIAQAEKPPLSFNELMSTPINVSAYVMNHLKIDKLTKEHLVRPTLNLLKGTCKRKEYPFDLSKPLPLIMVQGCQVVPVDYFINNDLETLYTAYNNPQGIIYVDKYNRNRLMRSDELDKFNDGTLTYVRTVLHDIASNLRMDYLPKRRWSNL
ncbi:hypothetical protein Tco_0045246 [Tanacetum coccineum]